MKKLIAVIFLIVPLLFAGNDRGNNSNNANNNEQGLELGQTRTFSASGEYTIQVSPEGSEVRISWSDQNAHRYVIYRGNSPTGVFQKIGISRELSYSDNSPGSGSHHYVVVALIQTRGNEPWIQKISSQAYTEIQSSTPAEPGIPETTDNNQTKTVSPPPPPEPEKVITEVQIDFTSTPSGTAVLMDGETIGLTPVSGRFKPGTYQLTMQKDGYAVYRESTFTIPYQNRMTKQVSLAKIRADISITTTPDGASITVNGSSRGNSPVFARGLEYGEYRIKAQKPGFASSEQVVIIDSEEARSLHLALQSQTGSMAVNTVPAGASVLVDGISRGNSPAVITALGVGPHQVTVQKQGYSQSSAEIIVEANKQKEVNLTLSRENGLLTVRTYPSGAMVQMDGVNIGNSPIEKLAVSKGAHTVSVSKQGYNAHTEPVLIQVGEENIKDITLVMQKATLTVLSTPDMAGVMINGRHYGYTPFVSDAIQTGPVQITVIKEEYQPFQKTVTLQAGGIENVNAVLQAVQTAAPPVLQNSVYGVVSINSTPSGAKIYTKGKQVGTTPFLQNLSPGAYEITIKHPGYKDWTGPAVVVSNQTTLINPQLETLDSVLALTTTPPGAQIIVNGILHGQTPMTLSLPVGTYVLNLKLERYDPYNEQINLNQPGGTVTRNIILQKEIIIHTIDSIPQGAEIYLNEKMIGVTPFRIKDVKPGIYPVMLQKDGYRPYSGNFTVQDGIQTTLRIPLEILKGNLLVQSVPPGAEILIGRKVIGHSGSEIPDLPAGFHDIIIRKFGYYDTVARIRIQDRQTTRISISLEEKPKGNIQVNSVPPGAAVYFNSSFQGTTPFIIRDYPEGQYWLSLKMKKYRTWTSTVNVIGNQTVTVDASLEERAGCCLLNTKVLGKPLLWYLGTAVSLGTAGYFWSEEKKAEKNNDGAAWKSNHDLRNGWLYTAGTCFTVGITLNLAKPKK